MNIKKLIIAFFAVSFGLFHVSMQAQTTQQGFFLDEWMPKSIEIKDFESIEQTAQTSTVTVTVDVGNVLTKVSKYVYGHNAAAWGGKLEQSAQCVKDILNLDAHVIRWPGGNMSNEYFWNATSKNTCPKDLPPTYPYGDLLYGANKNSWTMSLDSYYNFMTKTNSSGIICVNYSYARVGTSADPVMAAAKLAADWVRYDKGRTKYWEIGNENFGNWEFGYEIDTSLNKDGQPKTISGDLYGKHCKVFIEEMRKAAKEVGNDIKIGVVAMDSHVSYNVVMRDWNKGMMKQVASEADFMIVHSYYTPYQENSTVATILNSAFNTSKLQKYINDGLKTNAGLAPMPLALSEWNIFAEGSAQGVSYINGMHATLILGEMIKNQFGEGTRWDLVNGWSNGDNHALLADGEPGITRYTPRAPFHYMYYFQKYFGDKLIASTVTGSTDVISYASKFSSGQSGIVLVNKGISEKVVSMKMNNFKTGDRYYYYLLTGGTDNGDFSRKVYVNGKTTTLDGGGPADYATLKPFGTSLNGDIKLSLPKYSTVYMVIENDKNLQTQTIQFETIPAKDLGDADFDLIATASSGLPVQFASTNAKVAIVSNGKVHIIAAGNCSFVAVQDGNDAFLPAPQETQQLTVTFPTGITSIPEASEFEIFPNPASEYVRIKLNAAKSAISIYNALGSVVYSNSTSTSEITIPVGEIGENGLYFVKVNSSVKKLFISK